MAPRTSKQADRKAAKKAGKEDDEPAADAAPAGDILTRVKGLFLGSAVAHHGPQLVELLQNGQITKAAPVKKEETEEKEGEEKETIDPPVEAKAGSGDDAKDMFDSLCTRLAWCNVLGLADPASGEDAMKQWHALKGLELDFGPRPKRRGNPGMERIAVNFHNNLPQYLHLMLALCMLRALLFRSFFACLPWLVGYQVASLLLPLTPLPQLPQVPLDQVPTKFRCAGTLAIHGLVWFFFLFEVLWKMYWLEWVPFVGLFVYHAYAVRPRE